MSAPRGGAALGERSELRRAQIVDASVKLFTSKGFHATSVREIAAAVGVSVAALYLYFPSKEEILVSVCERMATSVLETDPPADEPGRGAEARLRSAFLALTRYVDRWSDLHLIVYHESHVLPREALQRITRAELEVVEFLRGILEEGVEAGAFRRHDASLCARSLVMLAHMWALKRWTLRERYDVAGYCEAQFRTVVAGIRPADARGAHPGRPGTVGEGG